MKRTTGISLKVLRVRAGLRQEDVARLMGCSRQRVTQLEAAAEVSPAWADRWKRAMAEARKPAV
jgi:transcriptional regulator with XRE-family HTH domain